MPFFPQWTVEENVLPPTLQECLGPTKSVIKLFISHCHSGSQGHGKHQGGTTVLVQDRGAYPPCLFRTGVRTHRDTPCLGWATATAVPEGPSLTLREELHTLLNRFSQSCQWEMRRYYVDGGPRAKRILRRGRDPLYGESTGSALLIPGEKLHIFILIYYELNNSSIHQCK